MSGESYQEEELFSRKDMRRVKAILLAERILESVECVLDAEQRASVKRIRGWRLKNQAHGHPFRANQDNFLFGLAQSHGVSTEFTDKEMTHCWLHRI